MRMVAWRGLALQVGDKVMLSAYYKDEGMDMYGPMERCVRTDDHTPAFRTRMRTGMAALRLTLRCFSPCGLVKGCREFVD